MTTAYDKAYAELTAEPDYSIDTDAMRAACAAGLTDGDVIALGQGLIARIEGDAVTMTHGDTVTATLPIESLSTVQRERMLVAKVRQAGRRGIAIG